MDFKFLVSLVKKTILRNIPVENVSITEISIFKENKLFQKSFKTNLYLEIIIKKKFNKNCID